jgi:hypothetical protein
MVVKVVDGFENFLGVLVVRRDGTVGDVWVVGALGLVVFSVREIGGRGEGKGEVLFSGCVVWQRWLWHGCPVRAVVCFCSTHEWCLFLR